MPAPYAVRETGAIGLGDGAAFAVLSREPAPFRLAAHALHNEMFHFTGNRPDGSGFDRCAESIAEMAASRRVWVKGHGTGTLEAGRLEAEAVATGSFPARRSSRWKGSLGHTLGSCGLVELAVAVAALRTGRIPGTVGGADADLYRRCRPGTLFKRRVRRHRPCMQCLRRRPCCMLLTYD